MEMKICSGCKKVKNISDFYVRKASKDGFTSQCKECVKKKRNEDWPKIKKARDKKKGKIYTTNRNGHLKRKYGIDLSEYNSMLEKQNNVCYICKKPESKKFKGNEERVQPLSVDHCHKTGKVRGLLCDSCNNGLGNFFDNIEYLQNAIDYIKKFSDE